MRRANNCVWDENNWLEAKCTVDPDYNGEKKK